VRGEVIVVLTSDRSERVAPGARLQRDRADDLVVEASRRHQNGWIVSFEGVLTRNQSEGLRGTLLYGEPIDDPDVDWVHELIGATVRTVAGDEIGTVRSVEDNPASDLLVLDSGALVPMVFVVSRDGDVIVVDLPEGLLEL
jgi:16S rRNA processing protein RimM